MVRYLGPANLGQLTFVLTFGTLFALFCDLNIAKIVIRQVSQDRSRASTYLGNYLYIQFLLSLLVLSTMFIVINCFDYPRIIRLALYIAGANLFVASFVQPFYNIAIAFEKLRFNALVSLISNIFYCLLILAAIYFRKGLLILVSATLATSCLELILAVFMCTRFCVKPRFSFDKQVWLTIARFFLPFALYLVFTGFYRRIDIIMLSIMKSDSAVGFYSAAFKIIYLFLLIPASLSKAIFPLLSEQAANDRNKLIQTVSCSMKYLLALSFPIAIIVSFFSEKIILILFGPTFLNSSIALNILIWTVVLAFWHSILCQTLIASGRMIAVVSGTIIAFICNVGLNLIFIPKYSYLGAAGTMLFSEFLVGCWFYISLRKTIRFPHPVPELAKIFIAALIMTVILWTFGQYNFLIVLSLGLVFYIITLWKTGFLSLEEKVLLQEALGRNDLYKKGAV